MYVYLQIKISLRNTNIPLRYSMVSSSTRLSSLSKPWRMPSTSRPPCNLTRTFWSKYFVKSTTASFSPRDIFERLSQYVSRKALKFFSQLLFEMSFICLSLSPPIEPRAERESAQNSQMHLYLSGCFFRPAFSHINPHQLGSNVAVFACRADNTFQASNHSYHYQKVFRTIGVVLLIGLACDFNL